MNTTYSVTVSRIFAAPRARVFDAFQRADALVQWFYPSQDIAMQVLDFEFRPEGAFRFRYQFPDGTTSTVRGCYTSILPPEKLSFSWVWEAPDRHAGLDTEVTVLFLSRGNATEVVITHDRLPSEEARERYDQGWNAYLDRLWMWLFSHQKYPSGTESYSQPR